MGLLSKPKNMVVSRRGLLAVVGALSFCRGGAAQSTPEATYPRYGTIVAAPAANVRACGGLSCEVRYSITLGETMKILGPTENGWLPMSRDGEEGWVLSWFVREGGAPPPELVRGAPGCKRVAMIFNIGVGYENRLQILEYLKREDIPATVFPMGWWAEKNPDVLKAIETLGFEIGSHGDQRKELPPQGDVAIAKDIERAEAVLTDILGKRPAALFTPYAAATDPRVNGIIAAEGYLPVGWDVPADDWDFGITKEQVLGAVLPNVVDGSIIEFHLDAPASKESTEAALPEIVQALERAGFTFVTISDMMLPCTPPGATPVGT